MLRDASLLAFLRGLQAGHSLPHGAHDDAAARHPMLSSLEGFAALAQLPFRQAGAEAATA